MILIVHSTQTQGRPDVVLSIDVCSHHYFSFMKGLHNVVNVVLSSWKMKPESTAAIPKEITIGYREMVIEGLSANLSKLKNHETEKIDKKFFLLELKR